MTLDAHPENAKPATDEIGRLRDQVITQAFVAGQMDAQYTAMGHQLVHGHYAECAVVFPTHYPAAQCTCGAGSLKLLKAKAYALALDSIDALIALIGTEARRQAAEAEVVRLAAANIEVMQERDAAQRQLGELLAVLLHDGGHRQQEIGTGAAVGQTP